LAAALAMHHEPSAGGNFAGGAACHEQITSRVPDGTPSGQRRAIARAMLSRGAFRQT
jgi:hypothetical protein